MEKTFYRKASPRWSGRGLRSTQRIS